LIVLKRLCPDLEFRRGFICMEYVFECRFCQQVFKLGAWLNNQRKFLVGGDKALD
jgi:hypothetical protein